MGVNFVGTPALAALATFTPLTAALDTSRRLLNSTDDGTDPARKTSDLAIIFLVCSTVIGCIIVSCIFARWLQKRKTANSIVMTGDEGRWAEMAHDRPSSGDRLGAITAAPQDLEKPSNVQQPPGSPEREAMQGHSSMT